MSGFGRNDGDLEVAGGGSYCGSFVWMKEDLQRQRQRRGFVAGLRFTSHPFAKGAKDGAPVWFWLFEGEQGQQQIPTG